MRSKLILFTACLFALSHAAFAQNLLQNSGFDTALTSWTSYQTSAPDPVGTGTGVWSATQDVSSSPVSGSANVSFAATPTGANAGYGISQCVDLSALQPVTTATFGARFKVPTGQLATGGVNVTVDVAFLPNAGCTGTPITGGSQGKTILLPTDLSDTTWFSTDVVLPGFSITPLASPLSAQVRFIVRRVGTNSNTLNVFFDAGYFAVNGSTPVHLQLFTAE
ncbi:MAG: hypothetical protein ABIT01_21240 [Thermoanaerobaculia bacterium]